MKQLLKILIVLSLIAGMNAPAQAQGFMKKLREKTAKIVNRPNEPPQTQEPLPEAYSAEMEAYSTDTKHYDEQAEPVLGSQDPDAPRILSFRIGQETGILNHEKGRIDVTVDPAIDFDRIVPVYTVGTGVGSSPVSGSRLDPDKPPFFTLQDGAGRRRIYELVLHLRGLERRDLRAGVKCGTLRMRNSMQGYPEVYTTSYFDNYGQTIAMINDLRTGTIIDYTTGKIIVLEAVSTIAKLKEVTNDAANLRMPDMPTMPATMQELENALKNGPKDVEYVYTAYEVSGLAEKFPNPLLTNNEVMPESMLARMNARKLPVTTVAGKPCFTMEVASPEGDMRAHYYSWKNISFGGGVKGALWSAVISFTESVPAGIFLPPNGWRTRAEWQKEADAVSEAAGKTLRKNVEPLANTPEFQAIRQFLDEYSKEQTGHGLE